MSSRSCRPLKAPVKPLRPASNTSAVFWYNAACANFERDQWNPAVTYVRRALAFAPNWLHAHILHGQALQKLGRVAEALEAQYTVLGLDPTYPIWYEEVSQLLLMLGDYQAGWNRPGLPILPQEWDGEPTGKTVAIWCQYSARGLYGYGDIMQFARYLSLIRERVGRLVVLAPAPLLRLLQNSGLADEVRLQDLHLGTLPDDGNRPERFLPPDCDLQQDQSNLPALFDTRLDTIPEAGCLRPDPADVDAWRQRLQHDTNLRVGIRWAGSPNLPNDRFRSAQLADFAPLFAVPGVSFYSLQKQDTADQVVTLPGVNLIDHTSAWKDFADTAAFMQNLDLVISVDTSCCHLAGALGLPCWTLIMPAHEWRWMLKREDSPWYSTMRLFRQDRLGEWKGVIRRVTAALQQKVTA